MHEQLDVTSATAARHHVRMETVGEVDQVLLAVAQPLLRALHVRQVHDLDLADQDRIGGFCAEPAARADQLRGRAERRNHRRLLDHHGDNVLLVVDEQVHAETERQTHDADDVLDHLVGGFEIERMPPCREGAEIGCVDEAAFVDRTHALFHAQLVEIRNTRSVAAHGVVSRARCSTFRPVSARETLITRKPRSVTDRTNAASAPESIAHAKPRSPPPAPLTL